MARPLPTGFIPCLALAIVLSVSACANQKLVSDRTTPAGEYSLVSVDGKNVPASVSHGGAQVRVLSGTFTIGPDGTCTSKMVFVPPSGVEAVREVTATYTRDGSKLTMQWKDAGTTVGTVAGDTFTMDNEGMEFVYLR